MPLFGPAEQKQRGHARFGSINSTSSLIAIARPIHWGLAPRPRPSLHYFADHFAEVIRQAFIAAIVAVGQPAMVQPQKVQDGGVDIVNMGAVLGSAEADRIGAADDLPALDAAAGQPH